MHKLMQGRDIDPAAMGLKGLAAAEANNPETAGGKSNCILITNMFDGNAVNLKEDPSFYVEIKAQV